MTHLRHVLPARRRSLVRDIGFDGAVLTVTVGFHPDGTPGEVFISGGKSGSGIDALLSDAAILASLALQHGTPPAALAKSMSRVPTSAYEPARLPASAIGAVMDLLAEIAAAGRFGS